MDRKPRPTNRHLLSVRAEEWIEGQLDSDSYFDIGRRQANAAARREVAARLQRTPWWIGTASEDGTSPPPSAAPGYTHT